MITTIKPVLSVRNGSAAIEFYCKAFGAVELMRVSSPDGAVADQIMATGLAAWLIPLATIGKSADPCKFSNHFTA